MRYIVVYEQGPNNWGAYVPDLPGCVATAHTREGVRQLIKEAIEFHIEGLQDDSEPVPEPGWWAEEIDVIVPAPQSARPGVSAP